MLNYVLNILFINFDYTKKLFLKFLSNEKSQGGVDEAFRAQLHSDFSFAHSLTLKACLR